MKKKQRSELERQPNGRILLTGAICIIVYPLFAHAFDQRTTETGNELNGASWRGVFLLGRRGFGSPSSPR